VRQQPQWAKIIGRDRGRLMAQRTVDVGDGRRNVTTDPDFMAREQYTLHCSRN
jgi:hypothetical protein